MKTVFKIKEQSNAFLVKLNNADDFDSTSIGYVEISKEDANLFLEMKFIATELHKKVNRFHAIEVFNYSLKVFDSDHHKEIGITEELERELNKWNIIPVEPFDTGILSDDAMISTDVVKVKIKAENIYWTACNEYTSVEYYMLSSLNWKEVVEISKA